MVLVELLEFTKLGLSVAVWCYVYFFLKHSEHYAERRPWEYLYLACMVLFLFELLSVLQVFRTGWSMEFFTHLLDVLELAFLGLLLLAFLNQHRLLLREKLIVIAEAKPRTGLSNEWKDREEDSDNREETEEKEEEERKENEAFDKRLREALPPVNDDPVHDAAYQETRRVAEQLVVKSEDLLVRSKGKADPIKIALFKDELEDLKSALDDPSCTTERLQRKVNNILGKS